MPDRREPSPKAPYERTWEEIESLEDEFTGWREDIEIPRDPGPFEGIFDDERPPRIQASPPPASGRAASRLRSPTRSPMRRVPGPFDNYRRPHPTNVSDAAAPQSNGSTSQSNGTRTCRSAPTPVNVPTWAYIGGPSKLRELYKDSDPASSGNAGPAPHAGNLEVQIPSTIHNGGGSLRHSPTRGDERFVPPSTITPASLARHSGRSYANQRNGHFGQNGKGPAHEQADPFMTNAGLPSSRSVRDLLGIADAHRAGQLNGNSGLHGVGHQQRSASVDNGHAAPLSQTMPARVEMHTREGSHQTQNPIDMNVSNHKKRTRSPTLDDRPNGLLERNFTVRPTNQVPPLEGILRIPRAMHQAVQGDGSDSLGEGENGEPSVSPADSIVQYGNQPPLGGNGSVTPAQPAVNCKRRKRSSQSTDEPS